MFAGMVFFNGPLTEDAFVHRCAVKWMCVVIVLLCLNMLQSLLVIIAVDTEGRQASSGSTFHAVWRADTV